MAGQLDETLRCIAAEFGSQIGEVLRCLVDQQIAAHLSQAQALQGFLETGACSSPAIESVAESLLRDSTKESSSNNVPLDDAPPAA